jgi:hypothetical protein
MRESAMRAIQATSLEGPILPEDMPEEQREHRDHVSYRRPRFRATMRPPMRPLALRRPLALAALVLGIALASGGGCGQQSACFTFSQEEFQKNHNACPAQKDALSNFSDPRCPGPVVAVNSEGTFDFDASQKIGFCCYDVTYDAITPDCGSHTGGGGSSGQGGIGGFNVGSSGAVGGASTGCFTCSDLLLGVNEDVSLLCDQTPWQELDNCACSNPGFCQNECLATFCAQSQPSSSCLSCLSSNCSTALMNCQLN